MLKKKKYFLMILNQLFNFNKADEFLRVKRDYRHLIEQVIT